jgi:hypothetical protein
MNARTLRLIIAWSTSGSHVLDGVVVGGHHQWIERRARRWREALLAHAPLALGGLDEVIAAAEALAVTRQQDHVYIRVEIRTLDTLLELGDQTPRDPIPALRPVQRDPGDAPRHRIGHRRRLTHPTSTVPAPHLDSPQPGNERQAGVIGAAELGIHSG